MCDRLDNLKNAMNVRAIDENNRYLRNQNNIHQVLVAPLYRWISPNCLIVGFGGNRYSEQRKLVVVLGRWIQNDDVWSWSTSVQSSSAISVGSGRGMDWDGVRGKR